MVATITGNADQQSDTIVLNGGIPDVMVTEVGAGEYYVKVTSANADYTVTVEEQK